MCVLIEKLNYIDSLKIKLDKLEPICINTKKNIKTWFDNAIIFNSNLDKFYDPKEREILELSHKEALSYIAELSKKNVTELNKADIINIHFVLFKNIHPNIAGRYRNSGEAWISLSNEEKNTVCDSSLILDEMENYFNWLFSKNNEHPIIIAAEAHNKFVCIHPFIDGNGRTARLIMNLILLQNGFIPIVIKQYIIRKKYDDAIKAWRNNNRSDFFNLIADCEKESLELYLNKLE